MDRDYRRQLLCAPLNRWFWKSFMLYVGVLPFAVIPCCRVAVWPQMDDRRLVACVCADDGFVEENRLFGSNSMSGNGTRYSTKGSLAYSTGRSGSASRRCAVLEGLITSIKCWLKASEERGWISFEAKKRSSFSGAERKYRIAKYRM